MPDVKKTAVVGLGQMGQGIARNLDSKELLCAAYDTESGAFSAAELSVRVNDVAAADMFGVADIILFAVPSTTQIKAVLAEGQVRPGQIIVDLTTSDPAQSRELAGELTTQGVGYVDAAMTGGAAGADTGTLTLMVGGEAAQVASCQVVLESISSQIFHLGPVGAGQTMKLVHNLILHSSFLATCEGLRLAQRAGLDLGNAVEVLNAGNARSFVTEVRFPRDVLSGSMMARSQISNLEKDLSLAQTLAAELGAKVPFGTMTGTVLAEALVAGHSDRDFTWLFPLYEELADRLEDEI